MTFWRAGALPIDFVDEEPQSEQEYADRQFVRQLRLIKLGQQRIELAIRDYYKAYSQRSRWMRESLLGLGELDRYERHLIDEWANVFELACEQAGDGATDETLVEAGRRTYKWATVDARFPIRRDCREAYVMRGSYHMLTDEPSPGLGGIPYSAPTSARQVGRTIVESMGRASAGSREPPQSCVSSLLLLRAAAGYSAEVEYGLPFPLVFLVLPVVLPRDTRQLLPHTIATQMHVWLQRTPQVRVGFGERARDMVPFTREALLFGFRLGALQLNGARLMTGLHPPMEPTWASASEPRDCYKRAYFIGRWFARAGSASTIYVMWGVRP
jgi:hypothetical protein